MKKKEVLALDGKFRDAINDLTRNRDTLLKSLESGESSTKLRINASKKRHRCRYISHTDRTLTVEIFDQKILPKLNGQVTVSFHKQSRVFLTFSLKDLEFN